MKFSIVTPVYNTEKYIAKAIDSVLSQKGDFEIEYIIQDGSSTDQTVAIIKSYDKQLKTGLYPINCKSVTFHWTSEKDSGQSDAINKGFKIATGDIVAWLNADDRYTQDAFQKISDIFKKGDDTVLVYGKCISVCENGQIIKENKPPVLITRDLLINKGNLIFQPSSFYRRTSVESVKFLDSLLYYWMEYDLYIKLLSVGKSIFINDILSEFTVREGQKSDTKNIINMDKELYSISRKYGGEIFSKIFFSNLWHKIIIIFKQ